MFAGASPEVFETIVANMAEGVMFLDSDDIVRYCNTAVEQIRRLRAGRILGRSIFDLHPPGMHHRIRELLASLKSGTISAGNRVIHVRERYFDNSYSGICDQGGAYLGTLLVCRDITEQKRLSAENLSLKKSLTVKGGPLPLVAESPSMRKVIEMVEAVAGIDSTVLVTGENGTGKERVVDALHQGSPRREGPLVRVNCAALPEALIESELFGHARGAFTGAVEDRKGKFELAHGGTLFLDEIGEMPLASQAKMLRAIQERAFQPVGARREVRVDVRIVAASNRDLAAEVARGAFREDLFYRLNVITIHVPPLRERREDILPLAEMFVDHFVRKMRRPPRRLSPQVRDLLLSHPLPGNVRQLKHAIERAVALCRGDHILPDDLPDELALHKGPAVGPAFMPDRPLKEALAYFERDYIGRALCYFDEKKSATAKALGISRKNLWEKILRHRLEPIDVTKG